MTRSKNYARPDVVAIGGRPLLGKTCPECGEFKGAKDYYFFRHPAKGKSCKWSTYCKPCWATIVAANRATNESHPDTSRSWREFQRISMEANPTRHGYPWNAQEEEALYSDTPSLELALQLGRTYAGVTAQRAKRGITYLKAGKNLPDLHRRVAEYGDG